METFEARYYLLPVKILMKSLWKKTLTKMLSLLFFY